MVLIILLLKSYNDCYQKPHYRRDTMFKKILALSALLVTATSFSWAEGEETCANPEQEKAICIETNDDRVSYDESQKEHEAEKNDNDSQN